MIGLPGETLEVDNGQVTVIDDEHPQGVTLDETYLEVQFTAGSKKVVLGDDEYFVLGDNRDASLDSRSFGAVSRNMIVGKVWLRGLPLSKISLFTVPDYQF